MALLQRPWERPQYLEWGSRLHRLDLRRLFLEEETERGAIVTRMEWPHHRNWAAFSPEACQS
jgi:hypothetical protein